MLVELKQNRKRKVRKRKLENMTAVTSSPLHSPNYSSIEEGFYSPQHLSPYNWVRELYLHFSFKLSIMVQFSNRILNLVTISDIFISEFSENYILTHGGKFKNYNDGKLFNKKSILYYYFLTEK